MTPALHRRLQQRLALLALLWCTAGAASAPDNVVVQAWRLGDAVQVRAQATVTAPHALIWRTLTDYDRLAAFVPGISQSRVLERRGSTSMVAQTGTAHLWFFSYRIEVVVESTEQPPDAIGIRLLKGNLKQLDGRYQLDRVAGKEGEFLLTWSGVIEPALPVPLLIALPLMRANITEQFGGMVREIERREALRAQGKAPTEVLP